MVYSVGDKMGKEKEFYLKIKDIKTGKKIVGMKIVSDGVYVKMHIQAFLIALNKLKYDGYFDYEIEEIII